MAMNIKSQSPLSNPPSLAGLVLLVALLSDAVLSLHGVVPDETSLFPSIVHFLASLSAEGLHTGTALVAFAGGIMLTVSLILLPMQRTYRARELQLLHERERLEASNAKLARQAAHDGLLGIANRREFERVLKLEWQRAARERQPLSLLMIDIDCFKCFNDNYGHQKGDTCLREVASVLKAAAARPGDLVARYGGEEMVVLMPHTDLEGANRMAERIHFMLTERAIPFPDSPVAGHVTVSIGVSAMLPVRNAKQSTLVKQADEGLYMAKEAGRNQTACVAPLRLISLKDHVPVWTGQAQRA